jgi:hypothetical protein
VIALVLDLGLGHVVNLLVTIAAGLGAIAGISKYARKAFRFIRDAGDGVSYVKAQMLNNGGSTLKDAVDRTEALALKTVERLDTIDARVSFLEEIHRKQLEVDTIVAANQARLNELRPTLHLPKPQESHREAS